MSSYVNLLKDTEILYRSVARDKKSIRTAIVAGIVLLFFFLVYILMEYRSITGHADELARAWKTLEPQYQKAKEREFGLQQAQNRVAELRGWGKARLDLHDLMTQIQSLIPKEVQLNAFELFSVLAGVEGESRAGDGIALTAPQRRFTLVLQGIMTGVDSEQAVLNFEVNLKAAPLHTQFDLIKLRETTKVAATQPGDGNPTGSPAGTRFSIDMQFKPRSLE